LHGLRWWLVRVWAAPYTLIGLTVGCLCLLTGGRVRSHSGVLEFHGGAVPRVLNRLPLPHVLAVTLGHVVLGRNRDALELTRTHERVHVAQFERWGPLMGIAYLACSAALWCRGRDAYRDNPFEREAFERGQAIPTLAERISPR
jgi:hypothetical protein